MRMLLILLTLISPAAAAPPLPADCPNQPTNPDDMMSLNAMSQLNAGPGMPNGGYAGFTFDHVPAYGTLCETASPDLPRDVLHGDPGDVLGGDASSGVLSGQPRRGQVFIDAQ